MTPIEKLIGDLEKAGKLVRGESDFAGGNEVPEIAPKEVKDFFSTVTGGEIRWEPYTFSFDIDFTRNINDRFSNSTHPQRLQGYEDCYLIAFAPERVGIGVSFDRSTPGWIFGYYDNGHGVSTEAGFLFESLTAWLRFVLDHSMPEVKLISQVV